jgi:hypothetical protein
VPNNGKGKDGFGDPASSLAVAAAAAVKDAENAAGVNTAEDAAGDEAAGQVSDQSHSTAFVMALTQLRDDSPSLQSLNLSRSRLGREGITMLSEALTQVRCFVVIFWHLPLVIKSLEEPNFRSAQFGGA